MKEIKSIKFGIAGIEQLIVVGGLDFYGEEVASIKEEYSNVGTINYYVIHGKNGIIARIHADTAIVTYKEKKSMEDMSVKIEIDDKIITENIRSYMQNALHKATKEIKEKPSLILCNAIKADGENIPFKEE